MIITFYEVQRHHLTQQPIGLTRVELEVPDEDEDESDES